MSTTQLGTDPNQKVTNKQGAVTKKTQFWRPQINTGSFWSNPKKGDDLAGENTDYSSEEMNDASRLISKSSLEGQDGRDGQ